MYIPDSKNLTAAQLVLWNKLTQLKRQEWPTGLEKYLLRRADDIRNTKSLHSLMALWCATLNDAEAAAVRSSLD